MGGTGIEGHVMDLREGVYFKDGTAPDAARSTINSNDRGLPLATSVRDGIKAAASCSILTGCLSFCHAQGVGVARYTTQTQHNTIETLFLICRTATLGKLRGFATRN
jgi:hypothetical protein